MKQITLIILLMLTSVLCFAKEKPEKPKSPKGTKQELIKICYIPGVRQGFNDGIIVCWVTSNAKCVGIPCRVSTGGYSENYMALEDMFIDYNLYQDVVNHIDNGLIPVFLFEKNIINEIRYVNNIDGFESVNCKTLITYR